MLSVIVITKNEEGRIRTCLESVKWADEIIVIDNGSTDGTLRVVEKYTNKIYKYPGEDFASIRNKGIEVAKGDWVLYVDADERVLTPLKEEVEEIIQKDQFSAVAISRRNIIFGREQRYAAFWPDWMVRLLKKSDFIEWVGEVHEYATFKGGLGYTKNSLLHLTHRNIDQVILKSLEWSKIDAKLRVKANHPKMSGLRFLRVLLTELFNQGIKRAGFFSGTIAVMDSVLQAFSLYITYVRLWELQQEKPRSQVYDEIDQKLINNGFNL